MKNKEFTFVKASKADAEQILKLYKSLVGKPFCAWTESYPDWQEIDYDLSRDSLYCMKDEDLIVGVITIDQDEAVESLPCWSPSLQPSSELSRLGVHVDYQNEGLACRMIREVMEILKRQGKKSVHYLVAKENEKAIRAYKKLNPQVVGEAQLFAEDWWCCEIAI